MKSLQQSVIESMNIEESQMLSFNIEKKDMDKCVYSPNIRAFKTFAKQLHLNMRSLSFKHKNLTKYEYSTDELLQGIVNLSWDEKFTEMVVKAIVCAVIIAYGYKPSNDAFIEMFEMAGTKFTRAFNKDLEAIIDDISEDAAYSFSKLI